MNCFRTTYPVRSLRIPGCYEITTPRHVDKRGALVKIYNIHDCPPQLSLSPLAEEFYTSSVSNTLRGLHVQLPPMDGVKLVTCIHGAVMDVVLDLRAGSPTCGQHEIIHLSDAASSVLCIPPGVAHGFYVPVGGAVLLYRMDKVHSPAHDTGVHWCSAGIDWPDKHPIVSDRDASLPPLAAFQSPFTFQPESLPSFVS